MKKEGKLEDTILFISSRIFLPVVGIVLRCSFIETASTSS